MIHKNTVPRILIPHTVNEALSMRAAEPMAEFWAGGTTFSDRNSHKPMMDLPPVVIVLSRIEELTRAFRTEQSLEIGAMTTLEKLVGIGRGALPLGLPEAITGIAVQPVRYQATIGGHLAYKERIGDLCPLLRILDTKVEVRYLRERRGRVIPGLGSRKIPLAAFHDAMKGLPRGGLITRISIPVKQWNAGQFTKIHLYADQDKPFIFCAAARVDKNVLIEFRMATADIHTEIQRDSELEAAMAGQSLPLSEREERILESAVNRMASFRSDSSIEKRITMELAKGFLLRASVEGAPLKNPLSESGAEIFH